MFTLRQYNVYRSITYVDTMKRTVLRLLRRVNKILVVSKNNIQGIVVLKIYIFNPKYNCALLIERYITTELYCSFSIIRLMVSNKFKFVNKICLNNKLSSDINAIIGLDTGQALKILLLHPTNEVYKWLNNH